MAEEAKDTIYVDIDDEITAVIDKVTASNKKIVALVLPKRAPVFQSIVNMKLLKRKSEEAKKSLVIVTTEAGVLPLAGAVGMHVAKTLASKPEIPPPPDKVEQFVSADEDEPIDMESHEEAEVAAGVAAGVAVGAVAGHADEPDLESMADEPVGKLSGMPKEEETIELDNEALAASGTAAAVDAKEKKKKAKKDKNLKVPNFERFRLLIFAGIGVLVVIIALIVLSFKFLPKATVDVSTNSQNVSASVNLNLSTTATTVDQGTNTIPAKQVNETKTYTATVNTTGQSTAQAASGTLNITAQECSGHSPPTPFIPAGTSVSQHGFNYVTQSDAILSGPFPDNSCFDYNGSTTIVASSPGSGSNRSNTQFTVNYKEPNDVTLIATGSASGGANGGQVVSQADIAAAEGKMNPDSSTPKSDLDGQLSQAGYDPLNATFTPGSPNVSPSTAVGGSANTVTVTETINYTLYGAKQKDLNTLLNTSVSSQVASNQSILNNGLSTASYSVGSGPTNLNLSAKAVVGPNINVNQLKHKIIGYKSADIQSLIMQNPNVTKVTVHFSPFFVSSAPSNVNRIKINISKPTTSS